MAERKTLSGEETISLGIIDTHKQGISIIVASGADLDSGTLTIAAKIPGESNSLAETLSADLAAGGSATYTVGSGMEVIATTSGASADVDLLVGQY